MIEQALAKWETSYTAAAEEIRAILQFSVFPACERIILVLEELIGWSML